MNIFQIELNRLGNLQIESNQLLDQFYAGKQEFDFLSKDALDIKYFGRDVSTSTQLAEDMSSFLNTVWKIGKGRFSDKSKGSQYTCFIGAGLVEVTTRIRDFVDEIMSQIYYQPYHSECAASICSYSGQIYTILQGESLTSADACFRQYVYLTNVNPFLQQLNQIIHQHLVGTDVDTVKQFIDTALFGISSVVVDTSGADSADMAPYRFVVDLLNGKLLEDDLLDHRADIRPVVEDDMNLKKSLQAKETVLWITQQYSVPDVNASWLHLGVQMLADFNQRNSALCAEFYSGQSSIRVSPQRPAGFGGPSRMMDSRGAQSMFGSPVVSQRKYSRRGRKRGQANQLSSSQDDLQPIILHALQSPILKPLL